MDEPIRISPEEARTKVTSGGALLVCAYDDDEKFRLVHLEGAISHGQFKSTLSSLSKDQEVILYCA
ncbi:MAG: ArsR family transcriptional regulator [Proteobacteria bacterium]|nr:ArsR family transcriptional regulator [Pseudomonadota bacterium]